MPTCTNASLNIACFRGQQLSRIQKLCFKIYMLANELKTNGGKDYTSAYVNIPTGGTYSLLNDSVQLFDHWDRDAMDTAELAVFYNNAVAVGAGVSNAPNTIMLTTKRLEYVAEDRLMKMLINLECQLGAHRNPPL
jgi:hypothetical protein